MAVATIGTGSHTTVSTSVQGITQYKDMTSALLRALEQVERLARLPADWDAYSQRSIQEDAIKAARRLLVILDREMPPQPRVIPVTGGGIQLAWERADRELEIFVHPDGSVDYARYADALESDNEDDSPLNLNDERRIQALMRWLLGKSDALLTPS